MGFFDMGPLEIFLILVIALIIWGPGKIPEIARTLGRTVRSLRKATADLTTTITKELDTPEDHPSQPRTSRADKTKKPPDSGGTESGDAETTSPRNQ